MDNTVHIATVEPGSVFFDPTDTSKRYLMCSYLGTRFPVCLETGERVRMSDYRLVVNCDKVFNVRNAAKSSHPNVRVDSVDVTNEEGLETVLTPFVTAKGYPGFVYAGKAYFCSEGESIELARQLRELARQRKAVDEAFQAIGRMRLLSDVEAKSMTSMLATINDREEYLLSGFEKV